MGDPVNTSVDTNLHAAGGPVIQREDTFTSAGATHEAGELVARLTSTQKLVPYNDAGVDGEDVAIGVLNVEQVLTAGDHLVEYIMHGIVRLEKLNTQVGDPIVALEIDLLQQVGIQALSELELAGLDNA